MQKVLDDACDIENDCFVIGYLILVILCSKEQPRNANLDVNVVKHFGKEWHSFTNNERPVEDLKHEFDGYFSIFPWEKLPENAEGFDAGCGSGR